jgi:hypothetical protein
MGEQPLIPGTGPASSGEELLTTEEVAARVAPPVSHQTIRNWEKAGMRPARVEMRGRLRVALWRAADVLAWQRANKGGSIDGLGQGGKRHGAGRKRKNRAAARPGPLIEEAERRHELSDAEKDAERRAQELEEKKRREDALAAFKAQVVAGEAAPELVMEMVLRGQITRADGEAIDSIIQAMTRRLKYDLERGKYLEVGDAEATWTETLGRVAARLESLARGLTAELAGVLGLDSAQRKACMGVVERLVNLCRQELVEGAEGGEAAEAAA